jgi:hypothetical protein
LELLGKTVQGATTNSITVQQNSSLYFLKLFLIHFGVANMARKFSEVWDGFAKLQMLVAFKKTIHISVPELQYVKIKKDLYFHNFVIITHTNTYRW